MGLKKLGGEMLIDRSQVVVKVMVHFWASFGVVGSAGLSSAIKNESCGGGGIATQPHQLSFKSLLPNCPPTSLRM